MLGIFTDTSARVGGAERSLKNWFNDEKNIKIFSGNFDSYLKQKQCVFKNQIAYKTNFVNWPIVLQKLKKDVKKERIKKALINIMIGPISARS